MNSFDRGIDNIPKVELRKHKVSTAKRFVEILNNPHFIFFASKPTLEQEKDWLKSVHEKSRKNIEHNFAIYYGGKLAGGCGIKVDQHRKYIGEIGYFVAEEFWGKGIAPSAVRLLERIGFRELGIRRMEIRMNVKNKASRRVAEKTGYVKEGKLRKAFVQNGKMVDNYLYAKVR